MQRNLHDEVYWSEAQQKKYLRKKSHSERKDMMTRNIMKVLHMVPMRSIMKVLYVALCIFLLVFLMGVLAYAGRDVTPLSESGRDAIAYIVLVALALTGLIVALAAIITGMVALYLLIFKSRVVGSDSPK